MSKSKKKKNIYLSLFFACMLCFIAGCFLFLPNILQRARLKEPAGVYMNISDANACFVLWNIHSNEVYQIPMVNGYHDALCLGDLDQIKASVTDESFLATFEKAFEDIYVSQKGEQSRILASDFWSAFDSLWSTYCADVVLETVDLVCMNQETMLFGKVNEADSSIELSQLEVYEIALEQQEHIQLFNHIYHKVPYLVCDHTIVCDMSSYMENAQAYEDFFCLKGCFMKSNMNDHVDISFGKQFYELPKKEKQTFDESGNVYDRFEDVADVYLCDGSLSYVSIYEQKVSGKLLTVTDEYVELDRGIYECPESIPVYKVYGEDEEYSEGDLKIGYDFTDFVLNEKNQVVAALVAREEEMDSIRVLIKSSNYEDRYHDSLTFSCSDSVSVNGISYDAGEEITLDVSDPIFDQGRVYIKPSTNLSRTTFTNLVRSNGHPSYRGRFEVIRTNDGLILINELLLEEYLYAVVPSEMPSYYENEALMSQAICARTYAYMHMTNSKLKEFGAHVDDSTSFQVYHNTDEAEATTLAIRNTKGIVMRYQGKLAEAYYYSTSCGYGTNIGVWHGNTAGYEYMKSKHIAKEELSTEYKSDLSDETVFRQYIDNVNDLDYEVSEGWYRWTYQSNLDVAVLNEHIKRRYEANSSLILTRVDDVFVSKSPLVFSEIYDIQVVKRLDGGAIDELIIEGKEGTMKIVGEFAARAILANASDSLTRQNGSINSVSTLLPSSFAYVDVTTDDTGLVTGFEVHGGGYGHGIGMSQNGANHMAQDGWDHNQILQFYYEGVELQNLY